MSFSHDDHAIQAFAADGSDQPFGVRILPRSVRRNGLLLDPKGCPEKPVGVAKGRGLDLAATAMSPSTGAKPCDQAAQDRKQE